MTDTVTLERPRSENAPQASADLARAIQTVQDATEVVKAPPTIRATILAQFAAIEPKIVALVDRHRDVAFDVSTPKGLDEARAARHDLRENGRYLLNRTLDAKKKEVNDGKKLLESETERLVALIKPTEDDIDKQITAREAVLAAEKAERERLARERRERFETQIARIRAAVDHCAGISAERIANGIRIVEDMAFGEDWAEFAAPAAAAQAETLAKMRELHAKAVAAELAAAEAEERRVEQERIAQEQRAEAARLKAEKDKLDAERAELERQLAELRAANQAKADAEARAAREAEQAQADANTAHEQAAIAERAQAAVAEPVDETPEKIAAPVPVPVPAPAPAVAVVAPAVSESVVAAPAAAAPAVVALSVGDLCERLGFTVTSAFIIGLGFRPVPGKGSAVRFAETDWPLIKAAIVSHIEALQ